MYSFSSNLNLIFGQTRKSFIKLLFTMNYKIYYCKKPISTDGILFIVIDYCIVEKKNRTLFKIVCQKTLIPKFNNLFLSILFNYLRLIDSRIS